MLLLKSFAHYFRYNSRRYGEKKQYQKSDHVYNSYYWGNQQPVSMNKAEIQNAYDDIFGLPDGM